jgi:hypothetical protein
VRHRNAQRTTHQRAEHRAHRVAVHEDDRLRRRGRHAAADRAAVAEEAPPDLERPRRDVGLVLQVGAFRPVPEEQVRLGEPEIVEHRGDLLDLLRRGER